MTFKNHFEKLAAEFEATILYREGGSLPYFHGAYINGGWERKQRDKEWLAADYGVKDLDAIKIGTMIVPEPIRSVTLYLTCLHELGHHVLKHDYPKYSSPNIVSCEAEAWSWALKNSIASRFTNFPLKCLAEYAKFYKGEVDYARPIIKKLSTFGLNTSSLLAVSNDR